MKHHGLALRTVAAVAALSAGLASAVPVFTHSAAVVTATHVASFDTLTQSGIDLHAYQEDGIRVSAPGVSLVGFAAFMNATTTGYHFENGGNNAWVDITLLDGGRIAALDFMVGDGWPSATTDMIWETFDGALSTGFGDGVVNKGSTVGWLDAVGFTRLRVAANATGINAFGDFQAIALDDVRIGTVVSSVPEPASRALIACGVMGLWLTRRRFG